MTSSKKSDPSFPALHDLSHETSQGPGLPRTTTAEDELHAILDESISMEVSLRAVQMDEEGEEPLLLVTSQTPLDALDATSSSTIFVSRSESFAPSEDVQQEPLFLLTREQSASHPVLASTAHPPSFSDFSLPPSVPTSPASSGFPAVPFSSPRTSPSREAALFQENEPPREDPPHRTTSPTASLPRTIPEPRQGPGSSDSNRYPPSRPPSREELRIQRPPPPSGELPRLHPPTSRSRIPIQPLPSEDLPRLPMRPPTDEVKRFPLQPTASAFAFGGTTLPEVPSVGNRKERDREARDREARDREGWAEPSSSPSALGSLSPAPAARSPSSAPREEERKATPAFLDSLLRELTRKCGRAAFFLVQGPAIVGFLARGRGDIHERIQDILFPTEGPSILSQAFQQRHLLRSANPRLLLDQILATSLGGIWPTQMAVVPIFQDQKPQALLYLDDAGEKAFPDPFEEIDDLIRHVLSLDYRALSAWSGI